MRDRREALKLLAGGTATALGASIITTTQVHADSGTASCLPTSWPTSLAGALSIVRATGTNSNNDEFVRATLNSGHSSISSIGCAGGGAPELEVRWSATGPITTRVLLEPGLSSASTAWVSLATGNSVRVVQQNSVEQLGTDGSYTLTLQFRAACRSPRLCWRCLTQTVTFTWDYVNGAGQSTIAANPQYGTSNDSTNCNDPAPTT